MNGSYQPGGFSMLPNVVKNLLIINGLLFLATIVVQVQFNYDLNDLLGLHYPTAEKFAPWQVISYMFMHGSFSHLFFNMFAVWMFGSALENTWGPKYFIFYYILTGLGAAFLHYLIVYFQLSPEITLMENYIANPDAETLFAFIESHQFHVHPARTPGIYPAYQDFEQTVNALSAQPNSKDLQQQSAKFMSEYLVHFKNLPNVVGASGSLFGLLLGFGMLFPNAELFLLFLPIPIKAKYFVIGYGAIELFSGIANNPGDNVAHFAHLGGMLFGFILLKLKR